MSPSAKPCWATTGCLGTASHLHQKALVSIARTPDKSGYTLRSKFYLLQLAQLHLHLSWPFTANTVNGESDFLPRS